MNIDRRQFLATASMLVIAAKASVVATTQDHLNPLEAIQELSGMLMDAMFTDLNIYRDEVFKFRETASLVEKAARKRGDWELADEAYKGEFHWHLKDISCSGGQSREAHASIQKKIGPEFDRLIDGLIAYVASTASPVTFCRTLGALAIS